MISFVGPFVFAFIIILYYWGKDLRDRWFAYFMFKCAESRDAKYEELKKDLLKPIHSHVSHDPKLRKEKRLHILEIGVGTGVNFECYPDGTDLVVIDPNPHFRKYYNENRSKFPNIKSDEIIVCGGEDMDMVESNSIDIVVMTLVLCSVKDIPAVVKQVHRVLAPGGKFFFFEHIKEFSDAHGVRLALQRCFTETGFWPFIFDGCHLNRDMLEDIKTTGFSKVKGRRIHAPISHWIFRIISPHLLGTATK